MLFTIQTAVEDRSEASARPDFRQFQARPTRNALGRSPSPSRATCPCVGSGTAACARSPLINSSLGGTPPSPSSPAARSLNVRSGGPVPAVRTDPVAVVASELVTLGAATAYEGRGRLGAGVRLWWLGGLALTSDPQKEIHIWYVTFPRRRGFVMPVPARAPSVCL